MGDDRNRTRARQLLFAATQLMAIARQLEIDSTEQDENPTTTRLEPNDTVLVELARQIYDARRQRSLLQGWEELFGEPAWDMLLDLFVATHENRPVSITSACIGAAVPSTTALRWLSVLEEKGLVVRESDPADQRRSNVRLSASAFAELNRYFRKIADGHAAFVLLSPASRDATQEKEERA